MKRCHPEAALLSGMVRQCLPGRCEFPQWFRRACILHA